MNLQQAQKELGKLHPSYLKAFLDNFRRAMAITNALNPADIFDPDKAANVLGRLVLRKRYLAKAAEIFESGHGRGYASRIDELQDLRKLCEKQITNAENLLACLAQKEEKK